MKKVAVVKNKTRTEEVNESLIDSCTPALDSLIRSYYKQIGKPSYRFILREELGKLSKMTAE